MSVQLSGASDDLIELDGDLREEFNVYNEADNKYVAFSNGVVLGIRYDGPTGIWRITPAVTNDSVSIETAPLNDDRNYSDVATIDAEVEWAVYGELVKS